MQPAIQTKKMCVAFAGRAVLTDVDLRIEAGQTVAVVGENGAGKTTLLACLAGSQRPTSGGVFWFGKSPHGTAARRKQIGMVAHQRQLYPELTARENLLFAARMCDVREPARRVDHLLADANLESVARQPTRQLSHGMRQRLSVLRAVVHQPPILLLDEPFTGLDAAAQDWLCKLLERMPERESTVCFTTHDIPVAQRMADRWLRIDGGHVLDVGEPEHQAVDRGFSRNQAA